VLLGLLRGICVVEGWFDESEVGVAWVIFGELVVERCRHRPRRGGVAPGPEYTCRTKLVLARGGC